MQAAVQADRPAHFLSTFVNVKDHELQSLPPSQDYLTPPDTALLRSSFPQLLHHFSEADAVKLMLLGLRDCDAVGCIVHGVQRNSKMSASQLNPVDAVFRMAADMSDVDFDQAAERLETAKTKAEEERLKAEAEAKKKAEEERLKAEAEAKKKAQEDSERSLVAAAAAAFRRRCFQAAVVACLFLLCLVFHRVGRMPERLRRLIAAFLLWRRWR